MSDAPVGLSGYIRVRHEGQAKDDKDSMPAIDAGMPGWADYGTGKERFLLLLYHTGGGKIKGESQFPPESPEFWPLIILDSCLVFQNKNDIRLYAPD